jgi:hypothetical protein
MTSSTGAARPLFAPPRVTLADGGNGAVLANPGPAPSAFVGDRLVVKVLDRRA